MSIFFLDHYHINLFIKLTVVYPLDVVVKHSLFQIIHNQFCTNKQVTPGCQINEQGGKIGE